MTAARRRWGQHFLASDGLAHHAIAWAGLGDATVVEVGPGRGALTGPLADAAAELVAVEIDPELARKIEERFADRPTVRVVRADALAWIREGPLPARYDVVSNLPYESGTAIVSAFVEAERPPRQLVVLLQREVVERMAAAPGSRRYGRLSIALQLLADVEPGRIVKPSAFVPPPKVDSRLVRIRVLDRPRHDVGDRDHFRRVVGVAFAERRKMIRNTLGAWLERERGVESAAALFERCGIDERTRPENVSVAAFAAVSRATARVAGA